MLMIMCMYVKQNLYNPGDDPNCSPTSWTMEKIKNISRDIAGMEEYNRVISSK